MKSAAKDVLSWKRGYEAGSEQIERLRRERIRTSNIVVDLPAFGLAFKMAVERGRARPMTGLVELQEKVKNTQK